MKIVSFGEILFDVFVHTSVVGGAPFNFVAHACAQGAEGYLVTAVGDDELGRDALREMEKRGVRTELVTVSSLPTGRCLVLLSEDGTPSYELVTGAYDETNLPPTVNSVVEGGYDALYYGTLAQRGEEARRALDSLVSLGGYKEVFFDINIRQDYYSKEIIERGMKNATMVKFSREEAWVFDELDICKEKGEPLCRYLAEKYNLRQVIMTLDADGALVYIAECDEFFYSEKPKASVVSTVGAGDSFSATYLCSYLRGYDVRSSLHRATAVASFVVEHTEAIPEYTKKLKKILS